MDVGCQFVLNIPLLGRSLEISCETKWCSTIGARQCFSGSTYHCASTPQSWLLLSAVLGEALNRRMSRRVPFWRTVTITDGCGTKVAATSRDISRDGIGLLHRDPIKPGRIVVSIPSSVGTAFVATYDVRRSTPLGQGWYASSARLLAQELD